MLGDWWLDRRRLRRQAPSQKHEINKQIRYTHLFGITIQTDTYRNTCYTLYMARVRPWCTERDRASFGASIIERWTPAWSAHVLFADQQNQGDAQSKILMCATRFVVVAICWLCVGFCCCCCTDWVWRKGCGALKTVCLFKTSSIWWTPRR